MTSALPRLLSVICLACLANVGRTEERVAPIRDEAKMFHAGAIQDAEQRIADIRRTFACNVFVRTVVSISPQQKRWDLFSRRTEVNRKLEEQARKYADESGLPGIYVVICTRPRDVRVIVRSEGDPQFTHRDAKALQRMLARSLHDPGADAALLALVDQVQSVLQDHATRGMSSVGKDVVLAGLLGGGLGVWLLLRMIRFKMRTRQPAMSWQEGSANDPRTQARETAALLGALFGFPGGLWIYDKLYPCPPGICVTAVTAVPQTPAPAVAVENNANRDDDPQPLPEHAEDASVLP